VEAHPEPEEITIIKNGPCFRNTLDFEARKDVPKLTMPPPDNTVSNLEQQGFAREVTDNTWNHKLDSEIKNKVNFDINLTNPQADIIATGCCEFWVMDIDLVKPTPNSFPLP